MLVHKKSGGASPVLSNARCVSLERNVIASMERQTKPTRAFVEKALRSVMFKVHSTALVSDRCYPKRKNATEPTMTVMGRRILKMAVSASMEIHNLVIQRPKAAANWDNPTNAKASAKQA